VAASGTRTPGKREYVARVEAKAHTFSGFAMRATAHACERKTRLECRSLRSVRYLLLPFLAIAVSVGPGVAPAGPGIFPHYA